MGQAERVLIDFIGNTVIVGGGFVVFDVGFNVGAVEVEVGVFALEALLLSRESSTALLYALIAFSSSSYFLKLAMKLLK
jgi:hypothetical protein